MQDTIDRPAVAAGPILPVPESFVAIPKRGLTAESLAKYQIGVNLDKGKDIGHWYPYYDQDGNHSSNKVRMRSQKGFYWQGPTKKLKLFGQQIFPPGSARAVTVVEGELDAPSAWQLLGSRFPCVSVASAGSAVQDCRNNYEYLDSFEEIVLCFDADAPKHRPDGSTFYPGQEAAQQVADLFKPGKVRILTLQHGKDPNEYLQKEVLPDTFVKEWWRAPKYRPDGVKHGKDMRDEILNRPKHYTIDYPWDGMNAKTYGIRLSELVLLMADTGVGKTSIMKEIEHHALMHEDVIEKGFGVGFLHLEEPNHDTALGLLSVENSKPYHLPDTPQTPEELAAAYDKVLNNDRAIFYDHFGSTDIDEIVKKVRYMAVIGCKYIFIDHLSIIVSDQSNGDERKALDEISTKLKKLCMEQNIALFCVIHTNRMGLARGSAGPEKVANIHMTLERDKKEIDAWRRNVTKITIEKNRFCGRTGPAVWLFYDETTGRMKELEEDAIRKYEEGLSINDTDIPF